MMHEPSFLRRFARNRAALAGLVVLLLLLAVAALGPWLHPGDPMAMQSRPFLWPGQRPAFPLGTDQLGRDVLSGLIAGARISMGVGLTAAASTVLIGVAVGGAAGGSYRLVDDALMRVTEVFQTIPAFIFVIVLVAILKPTLVHIVLAIALVSWPAVARIVRAEMLSLRSRDFVASCRMIGMSNTRIVVTQMLPNCIGPVIVLASLLVALAILTEAALSFLGLSDPNVMSWGRMIGNGRSALRDDWYLVALPGLAIIVTVLALNLIGEGVNDALNPRLRDG
jgi:peptide/nickel transport system permease protein